MRRIVAWPSAVAGYVETLVEQGEYEQARAAGAAALERCRELGIALGAYDVDRALALAEGKARGPRRRSRADARR